VGKPPLPWHQEGGYDCESSLRVGNVSVPAWPHDHDGPIEKNNYTPRWNDHATTNNIDNLVVLQENLMV